MVTTEQNSLVNCDGTFQHTDIVFYSSEPPKTLRELIFKKDIDGVFCANRDHLSDRANGIIQGQLRRILDLNHMRASSWPLLVI